MTEVKQTVTVKLSDTATMIEGVKGVIKLKVKASSALKLRAVAKALQDAHSDSEEVQKVIVDRYTEKDAEGKPVQGEKEGSVKITDMSALMKELAELAEQTVEVPVVKLSYFVAKAEDLDSLELDGAEAFILLGDLLEEDI